MLVAVLAVAILLFAIASTGFYLRDKARNRAEVQADLLAHADAVAGEFSGWFNGRIRLVQFASDVVSQASNDAGRESIIRTETISHSFEEVFFGAATNGELFRSNRDEHVPAGYDARRRPWYQAAIRRSGTFVTEPYVSAGKRGLVVTIAVPTRRNGRLLGITGSDFRLDSLRHILDGSRTRAAGSVFIVDDAGKVLIHDDPKLIGRSLSDLYEATLRPRDGAVHEVRSDGAARLVVFRPIRDLPAARRWYVAVSLDAAVAAEPLAAAFTRNAVTAAIIVATMLVGFLVILAGVVLRPLARMTDTVREIAGGGFDGDIPFGERTDEIGDLARALVVFRDNGREVAHLREQERLRSTRETEMRAHMMRQLQAAFGGVVDAASAGDLERRVTLDFADGELNALAGSVNQLIETISRGLEETCAVLSAIARNDLTCRVAGDYSGAFAVIKHDSNAVADWLSAIVAQLQASAQQLRDDIAALGSGARRLARCANDQLAAARSTSSEVQTIAAIVARHAADAGEASRRAQEASTAGEEGARVMREASAAMKRMTEASARVVSIADVLDGIARQTALVAINAGIEAERAGAAGRTFGVVADEVRHLANHAKAASQDVKATIGAAVEEVAGGAHMMTLVEVELMAMLRALNQNSGVLDDIALASRRQSDTIQGIRRSVGGFDAAAHDNLRLVQEIEAITDRVEVQASELDTIVDAFTLDRVDTGRGRQSRALAA